MYLAVDLALDKPETTPGASAIYRCTHSLEPINAGRQLRPRFERNV